MKFNHQTKSLGSYFFTKSDSLDFSMSRFFFYMLLFYIYSTDRFPYVGDFFTIDNKIFWQPVSFFQFLSFETVSSIWFDFLPNIFLISLVCCSLGFFYRLNSWIAFLLGLYLMGVPINFGKIHHSNHMPVVVMGILAMVRFPGLLSVDYFLKKTLSNKDDFSKWSFDYTWAVKTILLYMSLVYFASGFQKLRHTGLDWVFSDNMATIILSRPTVTDLGRWVASFDFLPMFLGLMTVFYELFAPLSLFNKKLEYIFMSGCCLMHLGAAQILGAHGSFYPYTVCFVFFIPWKAILGPCSKWLGEKKLHWVPRN